jgi:hypothetical protein
VAHRVRCGGIAGEREGPAAAAAEIQVAARNKLFVKTADSPDKPKGMHWWTYEPLRRAQANLPYQEAN